MLPTLAVYLGMQNTSKLTRYSDGSIEMLNMLVADSGGLIRKEADMNAVVVQMIEAPQEDGTMEYRRLVSIICKDPEMLEALRAEAHRLLR